MSPTTLHRLVNSLTATPVRDLALCFESYEMPRSPNDALATALPLHDVKLDHLSLNKRFPEPQDVRPYFKRGGLGNSVATGFGRITHLTLPLHLAASWPDFVRDHPDLVHLSLFNSDPYSELGDERLTSAELRKTIDAGAKTSLTTLSVDVILISGFMPSIFPASTVTPWIDKLAKYGRSQHIEVNTLKLDHDLYHGDYTSYTLFFKSDPPDSTTDEDENDDSEDADGDSQDKDASESEGG
jgi:hypothetical protein